MEAKMGKSKNVGLSVGTSSILVIFVLLCLTTFATLSMVSARADYKLTERSAEAVSDYYAADTRAEEMLAGIVTELEAISEAAPEPDYLSLAALGLPEAVPEVMTELTPEGQVFLRYTVPVGEVQELSVVLEVLAAPTPEEGYVRRQEWKVLNLPDADPIDEAIDGLWAGEDLFLPLA